MPCLGLQGVPLPGGWDPITLCPGGTPGTRIKVIPLPGLGWGREDWDERGSGSQRLRSVFPGGSSPLKSEELRHVCVEGKPSFPSS